MPRTGPSRAKVFDAIATAFVDFCMALGISIWLMGGVSWNGMRHLSHAADIKRACILILVAGWMVIPGFQRRSLSARAVLAAVRPLERKSVRWAVLGCATLVAVVLGALQALALRFPLYDVGIFHQILWSLTHFHGFASTISGAGDFLKDHLALSLLLLAPPFALSGFSPLFLPIVHPLMLFGGVAAWVWLAERIPSAGERGGGELAGVRTLLPGAVVIFALGFDSLWGNLYWGFHESAFSFFFLSWAFALLFSGAAHRMTGLVFFCALAAAFSKEIILVDVGVGAGIWAILHPRDRKPALALSAFLLASFVVFELIPHPVSKNYFHNYYSYLGQGLGEFARNLLLSPWKVVERLGFRELGAYFFHVFFPWLGLPFLFPKGQRCQSVWLLSAAPSFLSSAIATHPPLRDPSFHYVLELWPVLASLTVLRLARLPHPRWVWVWVVLSLFALDHDPLAEMREFGNQLPAASEARARMALIPSSESVAADELAGPWVSGRLLVSRLPDLDPFPGKCPDLWLAREMQQKILAGEYLRRCGGSQLWGAGDWAAFGRESHAR